MVGDREEAKRGCGLGRNSRLRAHNMTDLSGFPNFSKFRWNAIMLPWTNASHGNDFRRLVIPFFRCSKILGEPGKQEILQQMFRKFEISNSLPNRYLAISSSCVGN